MDINAFDFNLLKTFEALLKTGSVTKASEQLGVSQPAASASLRRLREALNDPLFVRMGHRLEPTALSKQLQPEIERILATIDQVLTTHDQFDPTKLSGTMWLSGSDFFSDLLLPGLLEKLRTVAPMLQVTLIDQFFSTSLQALESGKVDLAFWPDEDFPKWINRQHLMTTNMQFVARQGNRRLAAMGIQDGDPIPLDLACDMAHVHFSPDGFTLDDIDAIIERLGRRRRIVATVPTFAGVISIVQHSELIGTVPLHMIDQHAVARTLTRHPLPVERPNIPLMMLWHRRNDRSQAHEWLREQILAEIAQFQS